jgi:hypothetical protein
VILEREDRPSVLGVPRIGDTGPIRRGGGGTDREFGAEKRRPLARETPIGAYSVAVQAGRRGHGGQQTTHIGICSQSDRVKQISSSTISVLT